jgi:hypothetical protein
MRIVLVLLIIATLVQLMMISLILGLFTLTFVKTVLKGEKWECNKLQDDSRVSNSDGIIRISRQQGI